MIVIIFLMLPLFLLPVESLNTVASNSPFVVLAHPRVNVVSPGQTLVPVQFNITSLVTVYNVTIYPVSSPYFVPSFYQSIYLPELKAGSWFNRTVFFFNVSSRAPIGFDNVTLEVIYYLNGQPYPQVQYVSVPVLVLGYADFVVSAVWGSPSSPLVVSPGSTNVPLTLILVNEGSSPAYNVSIRAQNTTYVSFLTSSSYLGTLPVGTPAQAVLYAQVSMNAPTGVVKIPVQVYYNNGRVANFVVSVPISGITSVAVTTVWGSPNSPVVVMPGQQNVPLTIVVRNMGTSTLLNVSVSIAKNDVIVPATNPVPVGVVPAGGVNYQTLLASVNSSVKPGVYNVPVTVYFNDGLKVNTVMQVAVVGYAQVTSQAFWGTPSNPIQVAPGVTYYPLTVVLINAGTATITNATLLLYNTSYITFYQRSVTLGSLPPGVPVQFTVIASVSPKTPQGVISVPATLTFFDHNAQEIVLRVPVTGYQGVQVQALWGTPSSPLTASPGQTNVPLTFVVRNLGTVPMNNVTIYLRNPQYPFTFSQTVVGIGPIPAGLYGEATIYASVYPNATPGTYQIQVTVTNYNYNVTLSVPVIVYGPKISMNMFTYPPQLFQGYPLARLILLITNYGGGYAYNANVTVVTPLQVVGQRTVQLGAVPPGKPMNVSFTVTVPDSTLPGTFPVTFVISYDGGSVTKTFNVTIDPEAQLKVVAVHTKSLTTGASGVPITIEVKNVGNVTAKNLLITLGPNDYIYPHVSSTNPLMGLTASKYFVGDLPPGATANVTFIVDVASNVPTGRLPLSLIATWNQTQSLYPFEKSVTIYVQVLPSLGQLILEPPYVYGLIGTTVGSIVVITLLGRARRKKRS
ncbi:MAG: COG1361 S-layer family protein [Thermoprotei archaeon]